MHTMEPIEELEVHSPTTLAGWDTVHQKKSCQVMMLKNRILHQQCSPAYHVAGAQHPSRPAMNILVLLNGGELTELWDHRRHRAQ